MRRDVSRRNVLATVIATATLSVAGCTQGADDSGAETTSKTESPTATETDTIQQDEMDEIAYSTREVRESKVLSDGLTVGSDRHQRVVLIRSNEGLNRIERGQLDDATDEFLAGTDLDAENLLVIQVTLPSSAMEFTVERMGVRNETAHVWVAYSDNAGPQNEVVETKLVRYDAPSDGSPVNVVVHAENFPYGDETETTFTASD